MVKNEYSLIIDIKRITTNITPTFIQYDNAILYFNVYDNGRRLDLSPITSVQVTHKRPDGKVIIGEGSIETRGKDTFIKYEYLGSEMKKAGFVNTSVTLFSGQDKVTSFPFAVRILPDLREGITETNKEELSLLDRLFREVTEYQEFYTENYAKIEDIVRRSEEAVGRLDEVEVAEDIREQAESQRAIDEEARKLAEDARLQEEQSRLANEEARNEQESLRLDNEQARITEEDNRNVAEQERKSNENERLLSETDRQEKEDERNESEEARKLAETERNTSEGERIVQENNRIEAELLRVDSEEIRVVYEDTRQENERLRTEAEEARQQQETVRNQTFDERIGYFDELVPLIDNLEFVGPYDINTNYLKNNIVSFNGSSFIALEDNVGQPLPNTIEKENDYWALVALRGVDGKGSVSTVNGLSPDTDGNLNIYIPNKKEDVGLGQVDNTADMDKPVSNPQKLAIDEMGRQTLDSSKQYTDQRISDIVDSAPEALDTLSELASAINENESSYDSLLEIVGEKAKITDLQAHANDQENPHKVTKEQVGLGNVDNTSDMDKPVSIPQKSAIDESNRVVKSYVDERIAETSGSMRIESYEQLITATEENQTLFPIQDSFNPSNDTLFVFVDGEALNTEEYSITPPDENGNSSLELVNGVPIDALIRLVIIGNVPTSKGVFANIRGSLVVDGTIPQEKLTEALSQKIDEKAEKTSLKEALTSIKEYGVIGDGRDSKTAFQEAFATSTGTVLIPEGVYTLKEVHLNKDLRIVGTGKKSTLKLPTDLTKEVRGVFGGVEGGLNAMFYVNSGVQLTFENLTFDGDFFNQVEPYNGGTFLRIFKPTLSGNERVVINFRNCRFLNVNHSAMQAYGTATRDSVFINISDCIFEGGAKGTHTSAIPDKWAYGFAPHFIGLYDDVTLSVIGSKFIDDIPPDNTDTFSRIALYTSVTATSTVAQSDQYSSSIVFLNNIFKGLGRSERAGNGLGVLDMYVNGENAIISGNKFFNSQMQSIRGKVNVKNLIVTENIIQDGIDGAIAFHPNNYASKKGVAVIANNIINNCKGYGILLNGDSRTDTNPFFENAIVEGNIVKGITVVPYRATLGNGIFLKKVRDVTVTGNQFLDIQYDGVYIEDAENIKIEGNTIKTSTTDSGIGRGVYGVGLTGTIAIQENDIKANVSAIYLSFSSNTEIKKKQLLINNNTISEVRTASGQAVYVANFLVGIVSSNIIEGMKKVEGTTPYAYNFKGDFLNLIGNIYVDITGENGDPTGTQYGLKLKGNVTNLREVANSWQTA